MMLSGHSGSIMEYLLYLKLHFENCKVGKDNMPGLDFIFTKHSKVEKGIKTCINTT